MEYVELELVNQDEQGIGEIRVKGPNVMLRLLRKWRSNKRSVKRPAGSIQEI